MKLNRTLILLLIGLVIFEIAEAIIVGMAGAMGTYYVAGVLYSITMIRVVNGVLCGLLVVSSLLAGKVRQFTIVPIVSCAIELLLGLIMMVFSSPFLQMLLTPPEVFGYAAQNSQTAGLGILIGMVLAIMAGVIVAKKRIIIPLLVIVVAAVLSIAVSVTLFNFDIGLVSMIAVGFLHPFAFLLPAFGFDKTECTAVAKHIISEAAEKSVETRGYSYLEAYKNKHK